MLTSAKKNWHALKRGEPGKRFQKAYEKARRHRKTTPLWFRIARLALALISFALGVVFALIPGPGFVFFILSGVLLAAESRFIATVLDRIELRLHAIGRWAKRHWDRMGIAGRIVVVILGACVGAGMTSLTVWFLFKR